MNKIEKEKNIVALMIEIYCKGKHKSKEGGLCNECSELKKYAYKRLNYCKFGENKSTCSRCTIHCYKKDMREKIKDVMKYSGWRLIIYKPIALFKHMFNL